MVKSYTRYEPSLQFGSIVSNNSNTIYFTKTINRKAVHYAISPSVTDVLVWNLRTQDCLQRWPSDSEYPSIVTFIACSNDYSTFAVGYQSGEIKLFAPDFDIETPCTVAPLQTFNGHTRAITCLAFNSDGTRLASGSQDTFIVVWDCIEEKGLFRLHGHLDQLTAVAFVSESFLLSSSKDSYLKCWSLETKHCFQTLTEHRGPVWAMGLHPSKQYCWSAGRDHEVLVWDILECPSDQTEDFQLLKYKGSFQRNSSKKPSVIAFHSSLPFVAIQDADRSVEIFKLTSEDELEKLKRRRMKRNKSKQKEDDLLTLKDFFPSYIHVLAPYQARSISWANSHQTLSLLVATSNNSIHTFSISLPDDKQTPAKYDLDLSLDRLGHRKDIRTLLFSPNEEYLVSGAEGSIKVWNSKSAQCIRSFAAGFCTSCCFIDDDKYVLFGYKSGAIQLFEIATAISYPEIQIHDKAVWSLQLHPNGKTIISASADKLLKIWSVSQLILDSQKGDLKNSFVKELQLDDEILCAKISRDGKFIAVSLLDNTVRILHEDSLKLFQSLYGHKLPVLSMDISHDSQILVTSSADKNIKLWNLAFGNCLKSIFAHLDSILQVKFMNDSFTFVSVSRDHKVILWDGSKFVKIQTICETKGEVWALDVGNETNTIAFASHDGSIRIYQEGDDLVFLEEEREREEERNLTLEALDLNKQLEAEKMAGREFTNVQTMSQVSLMASEKLVQALDIGSEDLQIMEAHQKLLEKNPKAATPKRHALLTHKDCTAEDYVLSEFEKVKSNDLESALLCLPFDYIIKLLTFINLWSAKNMNIILCSQLMQFILKSFYKQIATNQVFFDQIDNLRRNFLKNLKLQRDILGINQAGIEFFIREYSNENIHFDKEVEHEKELKKRVYTATMT